MIPAFIYFLNPMFACDSSKATDTTVETDCELYDGSTGTMLEDSDCDGQPDADEDIVVDTAESADTAELEDTDTAEIEDTAEPEDTAEDTAIPAEEPFPTLQEIAGKWRSDCVSLPNSLYLQSQFRFTNAGWQITNRYNSDAACAEVVHIIKATGSLTLGDAVDLADTREIDIDFVTQTVTPMQEIAVQTLEQFCNLSTTIETETDIAAGCQELGIGSIIDCPTRYDIISVMGDTLRIGTAGPHCSPEDRPTSLGPSFERIE